VGLPFSALLSNQDFGFLSMPKVRTRDLARASLAVVDYFEFGVNKRFGKEKRHTSLNDKLTNPKIVHTL
jgi:hypothetical protein